LMFFFFFFSVCINSFHGQVTDRLLFAACAARLAQTMMDMIKSLEIGTSIVEHYVNRLHTCYAAILEELRSEQVRARPPFCLCFMCCKSSRPFL